MRLADSSPAVHRAEAALSAGRETQAAPSAALHAPRSRRVAYIVSRFPKLTETFVLLEMIALERLGFEITLFPLLRERPRVLHPEAGSWVARARYLPFLSPAILRAQWHYLRRRPQAYLRLWWEVAQGAWGSLNFFLGGLAILPKAVRFAYEIEQQRIEHVHAHFANHPAVAALAVHRLTGIPFSFTAHGSDLHKDRRMLRQKVEAAAWVVTISRSNRDLILQECGPQAGAKVRVIHCGVSGDLPRQSGGDRNNRPFTILCVGTLHEVKGQTYLIEACRRLRQRGVALVCHLIGDGPDRRALERQIARAGLQACVHLHGSKPRAEVMQMLAQADVAALASVPTRSGKREGIPVFLIEALACRVPAVASRISGVPELVEDGRNGFLAPPRDAAALAEALQRLHDDPALRQRMGQAGRDKVMREFNLERSAASLARLMLATGSQTGAEPSSKSAPVARPGLREAAREASTPTRKPDGVAT